MDAHGMITGAIVDSWVERAGPMRSRSQLVLQVAPRGRPQDLLLVEAEASLVADLDWLEDLGENLCHGSPVAATGLWVEGGGLRATWLDLAR